VRGGTIVVHGDGSQTRDYVFVGDVVRAMLAASTAPSIHDLIINVGSGTETSVRALSRLVGEVTDHTTDVVFNPRSDGGVSRMCADLTLAAEKLHYAPSVSLEEGLRFTLEQDIRFEKRKSAI
jgi:UDP-glucose 4-epimerase